MSRPIEQVYKLIIEQIPQDQIKLKLELEQFIESIWNKAPEVRSSGEVYLPFANILSKYIAPHEPNLSGWKKKVVDIFNGTTDTEFVEDMDDFDYAHHTMAHY